MENTKNKKVIKTKMSIEEVKELVLFMKKEKVASFSVDGLAVNFHPLAFNEPNPDAKQTVASKVPKTDEDYLFDAVD